ncbi:MAG: hypothetical protein HW421_657 [Ignavibacteria bacterium]|nr:hypothetical protein [Ignavibacteria bacterium]
MNDYKKYLQPDEIARLANLELKARLVVEGFITGLHRSPYHGFSVEFAEHRPYWPGDEVRHIDWKVFGRTDRYFVKQFEEETNLRSVIAVDSSASMKYSSDGRLSKFEYACYLAAAIAYMLINQRDAIGLALYDTKIHSYLPPSSKRSYIREILRLLETTTPANETGTAAALDLLAERIKRRGLVVIMSDFFDNPDSVMHALNHFRHNKHEVIAFQILDPRERDFKFGKAANFIDMETGEEMITHPYQIERSYTSAMKEFMAKIKHQCRLHNIDYHLVDTTMPFDKSLRDYMAKRAKM